MEGPAKREGAGEIAGAPILFLPGRAALFQGALLASDLHLGKESIFRRAGLAVPEGGTQEALSRLSSLCQERRPSALILLGDIWHAAGALDDSFCRVLAEWRSSLPVDQLIWVRGNHDRGSRDMAPILGASEAPAGAEWEGLALHHEPPLEEKGPWVAGHIHPKVRLVLKGQSQALPAFLLTGQGLLLPSFGEFTGGPCLSLGPGDRAYVVAGQCVLGPVTRTEGPGAPRPRPRTLQS